MDLLFAPKALARAVAPWLAMLLAVVGAGSLAYEALVGRPEALRFSREGRHVSGTVVHAPAFVDPGARDGGPRNRSLVAVNDSELGPQVISIYGALTKGAVVPVICLTPARRCMSATDVEEQKNLWPPTPMTLAGATELGLAALIAFAARRRRRPRVAPLPAVGGWLVPIALVALAIEGCSTAAGTGVIDAGQLDQQTGGVSFANDVYPIVSASCALTGCHDMGITTNHWTDYTTAEATYTRWVNGPGFDFCTDQPPYVQRVIVVPGDPDASYLMLKIAPPTDAPCQDPTHHRRMPPDPREPLTAASIETIRTWIAEGALQN